MIPLTGFFAWLFSAVTLIGLFLVFLLVMLLGFSKISDWIINHD